MYTNCIASVVLGMPKKILLCNTFVDYLSSNFKLQTILLGVDGFKLHDMVADGKQFDCIGRIM